MTVPPLRARPQKQRPTGRARIAILLSWNGTQSFTSFLDVSKYLSVLAPGSRPQDQQLRSTQVQSGNVVAVLVIGSLHGEGVELEHAGQGPCQPAAVLAGKGIAGPGPGGQQRPSLSHAHQRRDLQSAPGPDERRLQISGDISGLTDGEFFSRHPIEVDLGIQLEPTLGDEVRAQRDGGCDYVRDGQQ